MESAAKDNYNKSTAAKLQFSVLQLSGHHAARPICRGLLWPPVLRLPHSCPKPNSCGCRLWSAQPPITVPTISRIWFPFFPCRELLWSPACVWARSFVHMPLPNPALLPFPSTTVCLWPVYPRQPPKWLCGLPSFLQLWWLQLPNQACLLQLTVSSWEVQTRIRCAAALLLKTPLLIHLLILHKRRTGETRGFLLYFSLHYLWTSLISFSLSSPQHSPTHTSLRLCQNVKVLVSPFAPSLPSSISRCVYVLFGNQKLLVNTQVHSVWWQLHKEISIWKSTSVSGSRYNT